MPLEARDRIECILRTAGGKARRARTSPHGTQFGPYTVLDLHELPEDGKGLELEDGWLIEVAASSRHNWALRTLARIIERTDRLRKVGEYARLGIPQYWIVEHTPQLSVQVLTLADGIYTAAPTVTQGARLEVVIHADKPFTVSFDPADLLDF
jgi:hypothetical protein